MTLHSLACQTTCLLRYTARGQRAYCITLHLDGMLLTALHCTWTARLQHNTAWYGLAYLGLTYLSLVWLGLETLPQGVRRKF